MIQLKVLIIVLIPNKDTFIAEERMFLQEGKRLKKVLQPELQSPTHYSKYCSQYANKFA